MGEAPSARAEGQAAPHLTAKSDVAARSWCSTLTRMDHAATRALELSESVSLAVEEGATTPFDSEGCCPIHIIRPGVGRGRGRHLYEATMLSQNAHKFVGWRMYVDHQSPEARRAAGGLPRSVRDLGGRIVEARWDPNVPADPQRGYGQGAVVGRARPVPFIRDLIKNDPALVEASISASATGVRPVQHQGQRVWMVEGISDRGSVDWVTEAGAGGRVAPLIESSYSSEEAVEMALLESMSDDEVLEFLRSERPGLKLAVDESKNDPDNDGDNDADASDDPDEDGMGNPAVRKLVKGGMPLKKAMAQVSEAAQKEGDVEITAEQLQEALSSNPDLLVEALGERIQNVIDSRVENALREESLAQQAERDAVIDRQWELRDLRDEAHGMITESRLPESWQEGLRARFTLREDRTPTPELDVVDDIDDEGTVTKAAADKLREAVEEACKVERQRLAEVAPTRVRGQGPGSLKEGEEAGADEKRTDNGFDRALLSEAGIDFDKAYEGV